MNIYTGTSEKRARSGMSAADGVDNRGALPLGLMWPALSAFQQDIILILLSTVFGGTSAAYITNNQFGRRHSIREDRKEVLDTYLPELWHHELLGGSQPSLDSPSLLVRSRKDQSQVGDLSDHRTLQRTTWRDRRQWEKFWSAATQADSTEYRIAHRRFEWYLLRQFDRRFVRTFRWFEDKDKERLARAQDSQLGPTSSSPSPEDDLVCQAHG